MDLARVVLTHHNVVLTLSLTLQATRDSNPNTYQATAFRCNSACLFTSPAPRSYNQPLVRQYSTIARGTHKPCTHCSPVINPLPLEKISKLFPGVVAVSSSCLYFITTSKATDVPVSYHALRTLWRTTQLTQQLS